MLVTVMIATSLSIILDYGFSILIIYLFRMHGTSDTLFPDGLNSCGDAIIRIVCLAHCSFGLEFNNLFDITNF